ncbi:MAG: histidine phosphatase family protein [Pseudomonadota bacterium]|nr:histidine phosphatase family protein [Pseudomonadota bacterium]
MKHPEIFLIRHGQTTWNRIGRHQGQLDSVLTLKGICQVKGVAKRLAREVKTSQAITIASSPLFRCKQTAAILCDALDLDVEQINYDNRLMERCFGHWQGLTDNEINKRFPKEWADRKKNPWSYSIPHGGENYTKLSERVLNWLTEQDPNQKIILITHGQTGKTLRGILLKLSPNETLLLPEPQTAAYHLINGQAFLLEGEF